MKVRLLLVSGLCMMSLCLTARWMTNRTPGNNTVAASATRSAEERHLDRAITITAFCTRLRSYATHLAIERDRGVPYQVVREQFATTQSMHAGIPPHRAAAIAGLLVDRIYTHPDSNDVAGYDFWETCHRTAQ